MSYVALASVGIALPENVLRNDAWDPTIVAAWTAGRSRAATTPPPPAPTPAVERVRQAMAEAARDPFLGAVERRAYPRDQEPSALEARAAHDALDRAAVAPEDIDFILHYGTTPDFLVHPNACRVHERLGLRPDCLAISIDGVCNAFHHQLHLARGLFATGAYRRGLLVQSALFTWMQSMDQPFSPWNGDGATAQVVEPSPHFGVLAEVHRTDSSLSAGVVVGAPGAHWTQGAPLTAYLHDKERSRRMLEGVADMALEVVPAAIAAANLTPADIQFYASHQASVWFRRVTQEVLGLQHARSLDTFPLAGSLAGANLPLVLGLAEREGLLSPGDLVATYAGGSGVTYTGTVLRWGRGSQPVGS